MFLSIAFVATFIAALYCVARILPCRNLLSSLFVSLVMIICAQGLVGFICEIASIRVNLIVVTLTDIGLIALALTCKIFLKVKPLPISCKQDTVAIIVISVVCIAFALWHRFPDVPIQYSTSDPSVHLWKSTLIVKNGVLEGQFLYWYFLSFWIMATDCVLNIVDSYIVQNVVEVFMLIVSGYMMYLLISKSDTLFQKIACISCASLYVLGYPFNSYVYGFGYLGLSVIIFSALLLFLKVLAHGSADLKLPIIGVIMSLVGVLFSYALFAPIAYLAAFVSILLMGKYTVGKRLIIASVVLGVPVFCGIVQLYLLFGPDGATASTLESAISAEGGIFSNLFTGFVPLVPFSLFFVVRCARKRNRDIIAISLVMMVGYVACFFILGMLGTVSAYYYFKLYFLLWLLMFVSFADGLNMLFERSLSFSLSYCLVWLLVLCYAVSGFDETIHFEHERFNKVPAAQYLVPVYYDNFCTTKALDPFDQEPSFLELAKESLKYANEQGNAPFAVGMYLDMYWYNALTRSDGLIQYWNETDDEFINEMRKHKYLTFINYDGAPQNYTLSHSDYRDILKDLQDGDAAIFSNDAGIIVDTEKLNWDKLKRHPK